VYYQSKEIKSFEGDKMQRQEMTSSKIKFIGYYPLEKILEIGFVNSSTFQYVGVPESVYNSFLTVQSKSRFFDGVVKGKFLCRKTG
jgi:hypothetical protein